MLRGPESCGSRALSSAAIATDRTKRDCSTRALHYATPSLPWGSFFALGSGIYLTNENLVTKLNLLSKLGQEDGACHAVMLVVPDYGSVAAEQLTDATELASEVYNDSDAVIARVPVVGIVLDESRTILRQQRSSKR